MKKLILIIGCLFGSLGAQASNFSFHALQGLTVTLGEGGTATVNATDFIISEQTCCSTGIDYSIYDVFGNGGASIEVTCDEIGVVLVYIEGVDCLGQVDRVEGYLLVQDNIDACSCGSACCFPELRLRTGLFVSVSDQSEVTIPVGLFDVNSSNPCGAPFELSFSPTPGNTTVTIGCMNLGTNILEVWAIDDTGNASYANVYLVVQDNLLQCDNNPGACLPTPVLQGGLVVNLPLDGAPVQVSPGDFDHGTYFDPCAGTGAYSLSFSEDPADVVRSFTCDDLGQQAIQVWVTGPNGQKNFAETYVAVQDNYGHCDGTAPPVWNDQVCDAINLDAAFNPGGCEISYWNFGASSEAGEPTPGEGDCYGQNAWCAGAASLENSVWFTFTAPPSGSVAITTTGFDTQIAVWEAEDCDALLNGNYFMVGANDDASPSVSGSSLQLQCLIPGEIYWLQVDGNQGEEGLFELQISDVGLSCFTGSGQVDCGENSIASQNPAGLGEWLHFFNSSGEVIASLNDRGLDLPEITLDYQINGGPIRTDAAGNFYLDRNWAFGPESTFNNPISVRFYFTTGELDALIQASPDISTIDDLTATKVSGADCGIYPGGGLQLNPLRTFTMGDQTLGMEFELEGFSAFYVHGPGELTTATEKIADRDLEIWPNPAGEVLHIGLPDEAGEARITIGTATGQPKELFHNQLINKYLEVNISHFPPGIYFIRAEEGSWWSTGWFVKR